MMPRKYGPLVLLFLIAACNQAPDDDPAHGERKHESQTQNAPRSSGLAVPRRAEAAYQLQGGPGIVPVFANLEKCEAARSALAKAEAREDEALSRDGPMHIIPRVLVCLPV